MKIVATININVVTITQAKYHSEMLRQSHDKGLRHRSCKYVAKFKKFVVTNNPWAINEDVVRNVVTISKQNLTIEK